MKINITLGFGLIAFALLPLNIQAQETAPAPAAAAQGVTQIGPFFEGYSDISTALAKDDLEAAKKAAASLGGVEKDSPMAKHVQAISDSKSIEEARTHFKELSDLAIPLAKSERVMHEVHCPMAFDNKGASWLQKSDSEVVNPYMGSKMLHCGKMK